MAAVGASMVGFAALTFLFLNRRLLADAKVEPMEGAKRAGGSFAFLGAGVVWMCFLFFLLAVMAFGGLQNFAPPILERTYGVTLAFATTGLTAYLLGNAAGHRGRRFLRLEGRAPGSPRRAAPSARPRSVPSRWHRARVR
jgi:hypothetical protein